MKSNLSELEQIVQFIYFRGYSAGKDGKPEQNYEAEYALRIKDLILKKLDDL